MCFDMRKTSRSRARYGPAGAVYLLNTRARVCPSAASTPWLSLEVSEAPRSERSIALVQFDALEYHRLHSKSGRCEDRTAEHSSAHCQGASMTNEMLPHNL
jgi:hypothetical protein